MPSWLNWSNDFQQTRLITPLTDKHSSLFDFRSGCQQVSHQQQFFWELPSPGRSQYTSYWYSWVQTIYYVKCSYVMDISQSNPWFALIWYRNLTCNIVLMQCFLFFGNNVLSESIERKRNLTYRIYSNKPRGAYLIFRATSATCSTPSSLGLENLTPLKPRLSDW